MCQALAPKHPGSPGAPSFLGQMDARASHYSPDTARSVLELRYKKTTETASLAGKMLGEGQEQCQESSKEAVALGQVLKINGGLRCVLPGGPGWAKAWRGGAWRVRLEQG